jgi:hypothetical protein
MFIIFLDFVMCCGVGWGIEGGGEIGVVLMMMVWLTYLVI